MPGHPGRLIVLLFILLIPSGVDASAVERQLIGSEIPAQLHIGSAFIFENSDSLYLNGHHLQAGDDYAFQVGLGYFDLSALTATATDTLIVTYWPLPAWLVASYGRVPEATDIGRGGRRPERPTSLTGAAPAAGSQLSLSGAKAFRFNTGLSGATDFNQSLDLTIAGELSPGLEIRGSISDRGYDPVYGSSNSRLTELDKLNLTVQSSRLTAQIGDLVLTPHGGQLAARPGFGKVVSGASLDLHYPTWGAHGTAARPKGRFATFKTVGRDGFQGPYQIGSGANIRAIVPGSETIWLDGHKLKRGAGNDYTIDYPAGQITFTVSHPIDARRRLEIDYEPHTTDFQGELFGTGGEVKLGDSSFYASVSVLREGDDRSRPLLGELSALDSEALSQAGDSAAVQSGAVLADGGRYVVLADSLPDTVYSFVGEGNGTHEVAFSYLGPGRGDYRFNGGSRYDYAGAGVGEYVAAIILPAPERTDYVQTAVGGRLGKWGELAFDFRATSHDANLFSGYDDGDNDAAFGEVQYSRRWRGEQRQHHIDIRSQFRQDRFRLRTRLDEPDFNRRFLVPGEFIVRSDRERHDISGQISPWSSLSLSGYFNRLDYSGQFRSRAHRTEAAMAPFGRANLSLAWEATSANLADKGAGGDGHADNYAAKLTVSPAKRWRLDFNAERDDRRDDYGQQTVGTRYDEFRAVTSWHDENLSYEVHSEDTLYGSVWWRAFTRHRLGTSSRRRFGSLAYEITTSYQWLQRVKDRDESFLGRSSIQYHSVPHKLDITAAYTLSDERRNERGLTYLAVDPGQGQFILEEGQYVPDPNGDYVEVEELLSGAARVERGEKSFSISKAAHWWRARFTSNITEELKEDGSRQLIWLLPFYSSENQPYLFFSRRLTSEIRLLPQPGFHLVTLTLSERTEIREVVAAGRRKRDIEGRLLLKQAISGAILEEGLELFRFDRDDYYSVAGQVEGYELQTSLRQLITGGELSLGGRYRQADSELDESSEITAVNLGARLGFRQRGEFRAAVEAYRQVFRGLAGAASYLLTGNRPGLKGATWSVGINYGLKDQVRASVSLTGRHADDRTGRLTARGEVVAAF